jgi:diguanylate cyclase (GGDEF)-like protein
LRCRYGGDEFLVILPGTPLLGAQQAAENVRREIENLAMVAGDRKVVVTASIGVAAAASAEMDVTALVQRADEALYRAKRAGRNRSCVAGATEPSALDEPQVLSLHDSPVQELKH